MLFCWNDINIFKFLSLGIAKIAAEKYAGKYAASTDTAQYISQQWTLAGSC